MVDWRSVRRAIFPHGMIEPDVKEEIAFHIEERVRELVAEGWEQEAARSHVLQRFGNVASVEDACREYDAQRVDRTTWRMTMEGWMRDARFALRGMVRNPGFTAAVVAALTLGIGATTAVFSVVDGFLLRPLPFREPDRLVMVWENDRATGTVRESASAADYYDFIERGRGFEGFAAYAVGTASLTGPDREPIELNTARVTANMADVLGLAMQAGRALSPEEDVPGGASAVVLTDALWRSEFQADPNVLGRTVDIGDVPHTVVGILPPDVRFPLGEVDAWVPLQLSPATAIRSSHDIDVVARMAPGTDRTAAQAEMTRIMADLEAAYPRDNVNRGAFVERLSEVGKENLGTTLWVLFAAVLTVLAIACVNVANLLLARGAGRSREMAVHLALGAGAGRIRRRFVVEGALITGLSCAGGLLLAVLGVRLLGALAPANLLRLGAPSIDGPVLAFAMAVSVLIGLGFGLLPALRSNRTDVQSELRDGRTAEGRAPRLAARRTLVAAQLALAVVLLVGATLLMSTLRQLQAVDPGFRAANVLRVDFTLPASRYPRAMSRWPKWVEVNGFNRTLIDRVEALPGVRSAAIVTNHPLDPGFTNSFRIEGQAYDPEQGEITTRMVTPGYFETVGLHLVEGRLPNPSDGTDDPSVIVLNRKAVERYFPDGGAIGSHITFWGQSREVVGIVENEHMHGLAEEVPPALYVNLLQAPTLAVKVTLMVSTAVPPLDMVGAVRHAFAALDPDLPVFNVSTMEATLADASARERFASVVLLVFAGVAVLLAVLGVHGVLAYLVAQRGHEVGVRMALGATRAQVVRLIVRQGAAMAVLGAGGGVLIALGASRVLRGLLYGVSPTAPWVYIVAAGGLGLVALAAAAVPAWRAASIDPATPLRSR